MRANEFIVEANLVNKIGDFLQSQAVGRQQINKAKARKKNVPRIADAVQKLLALKVGALLQDKTLAGREKEKALEKLIIAVIEKSTKVDITGKNKAQFEKSMGTLKNSIIQDPSRISGNDQILSQISDIVNAAFDATQKPFKMSKDDITAKIKNAVGDKLTDEEIEELVDAVGEKGEFDKDSAEALNTAINDPSDNAGGDVVIKPTGAPAEEQPVPPAEPEDVKVAIKDAILKDFRTYDTGIEKRDKGMAAEFIEHNLEINGIDKDNDLFFDIEDELLADEEMPWNLEREKQFQAEVYAPGNRITKDSGIVFAKKDGIWSRYRVATASVWQFLHRVPKEGAAAIKTLIADDDIEPKLLTFTHEKDDYYRVSSKAMK